MCLVRCQLVLPYWTLGALSCSLHHPCGDSRQLACRLTTLGPTNSVAMATTNASLSQLQDLFAKKTLLRPPPTSSKLCQMKRCPGTFLFSTEDALPALPCGLSCTCHPTARQKVPGPSSASYLSAWSTAHVLHLTSPPPPFSDL